MWKLTPLLSWGRQRDFNGQGRGEDLVDLQTIAFAQEGWFTTPGTIESGDEKYLREALEMGIDLIGAM